MKIKMSEEEFVEHLKNDAIKTSNKEQARKLIEIVKKHKIGFNYAIIWDDVKQGSIFSFSDKTITISRDIKCFEGKKVINFKDIIFTERSSDGK